MIKGILEGHVEKIFTKRADKTQVGYETQPKKKKPPPTNQTTK